MKRHTRRLWLGRLSLVLACLFACAMNHSVNAELIAYYPFEGDTTDATGNGNDGIESGDATPAGPFSGFDGVGQAYEFFGAGQVEIPIDINPTSIPDLTVTMWVRPDESVIDAPGLYKAFGHDNGGWDRTFGLDTREDGIFRYAAFTGGARPGPSLDTGTEVEAEWTFLAAVWDTDGDGPGSHVLRFHAGDNFIEEPLLNTAGFPTAAIGDLRADGFFEGWNGLIDDVRMFDTAMTPEQISNIMTIGVPDVEVTLNAILTADQEAQATTGVPNTATGMATATYNYETGDLSWNVEWSDLSGDATGMHIHAPADVGANAGVAVNLGGISGLTSPSAGSDAISPAVLEQILAGDSYVNIHTATNGPGEIRGQLLVTSDANWTGSAPVGQWDTAGNWSKAPATNTHVRISDGASVQGSASDATVFKTSIGAGVDQISELRLQAGQTLTSLGGVDVGSNGRLLGAGQLVGPLDVQSNGELVVLAGDTFQVSTMRPVSGTVNVLGDLTVGSDATNLAGGVINVSGGTLTVPGNGTKDGVGLTNLSRLNLTRAIVNGDVHSPSGSEINVGVGVVFNGLVSGAADFPGTGSVTFNGGFDPGDSPAKMQFAGDITFGDENTVRFEIGGLLAGDQYDQLNIAGDVDFGGTLLVELTDDFVPSVGDEFVLMNFGSRSDDWFAEVDLPVGDWIVQSSATQVTLLAVPEPTGAIFLFSSLPLFAWIRRRGQQSATSTSGSARRGTRLAAGLAIVALLIVSAAPAQADLIAHYPFDGDATDATGNGNDGIVEGDAAPSGPFSGFDGAGGAFSFDGAGHVIVPLDINPDQIEEFSVTMWVKPDEAAVAAPGLYKTFGHDDGGWDRTFGLDTRNDGLDDPATEGGFRYSAFTGGFRPGPTASTGTEVTADWTFLAAVWSFDDGTVTFHANENFVEEPLTETFSVHTEAAIGNLRPDNFAEGWRGLIDDVRIFDHALSVDEVADVRAIGQTTEQEFINAAGGLWTTGSNWTGVGSPNEDTTAIINAASNLTVIGPDSDTTITRLNLSGAGGIGELRMVGDHTFTATNGVGIGNNGRLLGRGTIAGNVIVSAGGDLTVLHGESLTLDGVLGVGGQVSVMGDLELTQDSTVSAGGSIVVVGGGLSVPGDGAVGLSVSGSLDLTNATVNGNVKSEGGSDINVVEEATFQGRVGGSANFPGAGKVNLMGGYSPGDGAAGVQFGGDVELGADNILAIEVGGTTAGVDFDQMDVNGAVSVDGNLDVSLIGGFTPTEGTSFAIVTGSSISGQFANVQFPGGGWSINYAPTSITLNFGGGGPLPGDYNGDGSVDLVDINLQADAIAAANPDLATYDENNDGTVDTNDRLILIRDHIGTWMGDANLDGSFGTSDLVTVFGAGKYETGAAADWSEGDWNGDGAFSTADLVAAFGDGGFEMGPRTAVAAVPEPTSAWLASLSLLGLLAIRRNR